MKNIHVFMVRILIALVFIASGYSKLLEPYDRVLDAVMGYQILSEPVARLFAFFLPWAELILGAFFLCGLWLEASMLLLWAMNFIFLLTVGSVLARGISLAGCGCFGESFIKLTPLQIIGLDLTLFAGFFYLAMRHDDNLRFSLDGVIEKKCPCPRHGRQAKV